MLDTKPRVEEPGRPTEHDGQFGQFEDTGIGTDLTLEWDSNDPELHVHLVQRRSATEPAEPKKEGEEDYYRYYSEAGLPDA